MKVSIIIPTYNYARYITEAVNSVLAQDYPQNLMEIIVVDDGSTDDTRQVLHPLVEAGLVRYYFQPNAGKAVATQKGIELAEGELIFNLDADDWFLPGKINNTVSMFVNNRSLVHVATPALIHWEDGGSPDKPEPVPEKLLGRPAHGRHLLEYFFDHNLLFGGGSTFAAKAEILKKMRWSPAADMYTDEWLLIETLLKGDCYLLPAPLSVWRIHGNNYSSGKPDINQGAKQERLKASSATMLRFITSGDYPRWLKKTYRLKHEVRCMVWLEESNTKSAGDILRFIRKGIFSGNSIGVLRKYHAFNRLVPMWLTRRLKGQILPV